MERPVAHRQAGDWQGALVYLEQQVIRPPLTPKSMSFDGSDQFGQEALLSQEPAGLPPAHVHTGSRVDGVKVTALQRGRWGLRPPHFKSRSFCNYQDMLFIFCNRIVRQAQWGSSCFCSFPIFICVFAFTLQVN